MKHFALYFLLILALATFLRLQHLDQRPMHGDEAHQATQFKRLWLEGNYQYYAKDFHGPSLYYLSLPLVNLSSAKTYEDLSKWHLRGVTVFFSLLCLCLFPLLQKSRALLFAAFFFAISPAMVYYSRYFIQEPLFMCFGLIFLLSLWRYFLSRQLGWALGAGVGLGLMQSTKETFILSLAALAVAILVCYFVYLKENKEKFSWPTINKKHLLPALLVAAFISVLFYSSFFKNVQGPIDSLRAFSSHFKRGAGGNFEEDITQGAGHVKEVSYFAKTLFFHYNDSASEFFPSIFKNKPFRPFSEILILILAVTGSYFSFRKKTDQSGQLARLLAVYSFTLFLIYSLIPYKTPWCLLSFHLGFILLAGFGLAELSETIKSKRWAPVVFLLIALMSVDLIRQVNLQSRRVAAEGEHNPYAYSHTTDDLEEKVKSREFLTQHPVIMLTGDFSPLQWYLKACKVAYLEDRNDQKLELKKLPIIIVSADNDEINEELKKTHHADLWSLRKNVFLYVHVRQDIWNDFLAKQNKHETNKD